MNNDKWLDRWLPLIKEKCSGESLLEIGCGWGWDTKVLVDAGLSVIGLDMTDKYLDQARTLVPDATFLLGDMRHGLPDKQKYNIIIASLSMHYMSWIDTLKTISKVKDSLNDEGVFICRLNSVKDFNHGAIGNPKIGENFYLVDGKPKRFFDEKDVRMLFASEWKIISAEEHTIDRFEDLKVVWEVVVGKEK